MAWARAKPAKTSRNPTPTSQQVGPCGPKHPGNRQLPDKRGRPDAGAHSCGIHANPKLATYCAALWPTFTLPLTLSARPRRRSARPERMMRIGKRSGRSFSRRLGCAVRSSPKARIWRLHYRPPVRRENSAPRFFLILLTQEPRASRHGSRRGPHIRPCS